MNHTRFLNRIVLAFTLAFLCLAVRSQDYLYTTNGGNVTITKYSGLVSTATIPSRIDGMPVTRIGNRAFENHTTLTSVVIPDGVISVGEGAFHGCSRLADITIPDSVTSIGNHAFYSCTSLTNVKIGSSVASIGDFLFCLCTSLTNVTIPDSVTSIGTGAFNSCSNLTSVTIPERVTRIGALAFASCASLASVKLGTSVVDIWEGAFQYCTSLTDVTIPNGVTRISSNMFTSCTSLTNVTIPSSVINIDFSVFTGCGSLTRVCFRGKAPTGGGQTLFSCDSEATVYYLPGTTGWGPTFGGRPTSLWCPQVEMGDTSFGVQKNQFGFNISWASDWTVVVEAWDTGNPVWCPVGTNTITYGSSYFNDPQWAQYPSRLYRLRSP